MLHAKPMDILDGIAPGDHAARALRLLTFAFDPDPPARLHRAILLNLRLEGAQALHILFRHPGRHFTPLGLMAAMRGSEVPPLPTAGDIPSVDICEANIPRCDLAAISQVRRRLQHLQQILPGIPKESNRGIRREIRALKTYLNESVAPNGTIRSFPDARHKERQRIYSALHRFQDKLSRNDPALAEYISAHLHLGSTFAWMPPP